jgi:hypothetical protein
MNGLNKEYFCLVPRQGMQAQIVSIRRKAFS